MMTHAPVIVLCAVMLPLLAWLAWGHWERRK